MVLTKVDAARELLARRRARANLLDFVRYTWWMPEDFKVGIHTRAIAARLTRAIADYERGISTFILVCVPFRHGKSDLVSRALPSYFLGRCADRQPDVIMSGYGGELVEGFSRRAQSIIESDAYQTLFPGIRLNPKKSASNKWGIADSAGEVTAVGLGGAITGHGGALIVVDDYCKSRAEAESETYRESTWEAFTDATMTRRAPVSIVVVAATPWHEDDVAGRIQKRQAEDPNFPRFEVVRYPASGEVARNDYGMDYESTYLFPERFTDEWYLSQYATLGTYASSGLLDVTPHPRSGFIFNPELFQVHHDAREFPDARYVRSWDLASTAKERDKDDPDYTTGVKMAMTREPGSDVPHLWIRHGVHCQHEAPERDRLIRRTIESDGSSVVQVLESVAGYKDTFTNFNSLFRGIAKVVKAIVSADKLVRAAPLEAVVEAGNVHVLNGPWLSELKRHFSTFPKGHDDYVDAVSAGYAYLKRPLQEVRVYGT